MACPFRSKIEGKKRIQNLTHNCLFDMWSLKSSFFSKRYPPVRAVSFTLKVLRRCTNCFLQQVVYALSFVQFWLLSLTAACQSHYLENLLSFTNASKEKAVWATYPTNESSNNHLLSKKKNNINTFGHFSQWEWIICKQTNWNKSKRNEGE